MIIKTTEVFLVFLRLGLTSFGGPIAHLGYFHNEFVRQKKWMDEQTYADLVALCQFLPGPASSQVGMAIGLSYASYFGAIAAWLGFTLPSAILLVLFGFGITNFHFSDSWLHGLKIVAVAVVAQAIWAMAIKHCSNKQRMAIAILVAFIITMTSSVWLQLILIILGGVMGVLFLHSDPESVKERTKTKVSQRIGLVSLLLFVVLLILLPLLVKITGAPSLQLMDSFFRAGSLVFGGGHVVLPLLQAEVLRTGLMSNEMFMAGYGAAQAIPGPLFSFSAYLGTVSKIQPSGWMGAVICLVSVFLPSFLLVVGILPFWERVRSLGKVRRAMQGINAAVVGLLVSAFYNPVWTSAIFTPKDFFLAGVCFFLLTFCKVQSWIVVFFGAAIGGILL